MSVESKYSINFTKSRKKFMLSVHYNALNKKMKFSIKDLFRKYEFSCGFGNIY